MGQGAWWPAVRALTGRVKSTAKSTLLKIGIAFAYTFYPLGYVCGVVYAGFMAGFYKGREI